MYTADDMVYELEDTEIDSNYTCTYYPWVKYHDTVNNKFIFLPPTKDVVRNMAMTDNTTHPWFAPAGISRGDVVCAKAKFVTKLEDEDILYNGRVNPIKTFASDGVKIWGQKNLQINESLLNRIAVRRLLLRLRKLISISCIGLIFDPNDITVKNKFLSTVTPILDNIKANRGISDYRIEVDDSAEARDRRELPCKLYFKPYQALEYVTLDFIVTQESVSFDSI
jgi:phage tail sheath protein FI